MALIGKLKKVTGGQALQIPASTYNAFVDAAESHIASQLGQETDKLSGQGLRNNPVLVKNSSGVNCNQSEILGIDRPLISPALNLDEFRNRLGVTGVMPIADNHTERLVILAEPILKDAIGYGWISGVCQVKLDVSDEASLTAGIVDQNKATLKAGEGSIPILWKESGVGVKWGLVRLGGGGGGGSGFAVVRATYAATSTDRKKIDVQEVRVDVNGVARFVGEGVKTVYAWPGLLSENYAALTWLGMQDPIPTETVIVSVTNIGGKWYVEQWSGLRYRLLARPLNVRQTDCISQEASF